MVSKIMRKFVDMPELEEEEIVVSNDIVKLTLIGTLIDKDGEKNNVFK